MAWWIQSIGHWVEFIGRLVGTSPQKNTRTVKLHFINSLLAGSYKYYNQRIRSRPRFQSVFTECQTYWKTFQVYSEIEYSSILLILAIIDMAIKLGVRFQCRHSVTSTNPGSTRILLYAYVVGNNVSQSLFSY